MAVRLREAEAAALQARLQRLVRVLVGTSRALAPSPKPKLSSAAPGAGGARLQRTSSQGSIEVRAMHAACVEHMQGAHTGLEHGASVVSSVITALGVLSTAACMHCGFAETPALARGSTL